MSNTQQAFTLIELVVVIVIIGILAAIALPKFANLTTQARTSQNQGVSGGLASAALIAHTSWIASGAPNSGSPTVTLDGSTVSLNTNGWPDGGGGVTPTAAQCVTLWNSILKNAPTVGTTCAAGINTCYVATAATSICTYTLNSNGAAVTPATSITFNTSTGAIVTTP